MADPLTCSVRTVSASDGTSIPVPFGGLGLPDGSSATIDPNAQVQINVKTDANGNTVGYFVVLNNPSTSSEAAGLFVEFSQESAIATLEQLATSAITTIAPAAFKAAGLILGVLVTLLTSSQLTREVFIRCDLDTGMATDGPPVTYCLLLAP
jgi:hypothetical protein